MSNDPKQYFDIFSGSAERFRSLDGAVATGAGASWFTQKPRKSVSMQVSYPAGPSVVKVTLEGTINGLDWVVLATFDTGAGSVEGDIVSASTHNVLGVRASLVTNTGAGSITADITSTSLG